MSQYRRDSSSNKRVCKSSTSILSQPEKSRLLISTLPSSQPSSLHSNQGTANVVPTILLEGALNNTNDEYRKELRDLVRRQKQERAMALKMAEEEEFERNRKIATNLAAIEKAAKKASKLPLNLRKNTPSNLKRKAYNGVDNYSAVIPPPADEIPRECVLRASELLAEDQPLKKPCRPVSRKLVPSHQSRQLHQRPTASNNDAKPRSSKTKCCVPPEASSVTGSNAPFKSCPETGIPKSSTSKAPPFVPGAATISKSLPSKSHLSKSKNGFGVQVDLRYPAHYERHAEVVSSWKDAQSEQARLKARLCVSRTRRFVHLDAEDDGIDSNDDDKVETSESSSITSGSSTCDQDKANKTLTPNGDADEISVEVEGPSLKPLRNSHPNHVQKRSSVESDPLRFMEVYKMKRQQMPYDRVPPSRKDSNVNGISDIKSDMDKTSDAASTLPSMLEDSRPVGPVAERRMAPDALGLSLTAELHRYETLSASDQHIAEMEMTRQISLAKLGSRGRGMTYVEHLQEVENQAMSPIVLPLRGRVPVTLTQTITQRSFTTSTTGAAATAQFMPNHTQMTAANSLVGASVHNYCVREIGPDASDLNPIDAITSNLEVSSAFGEMIEKQSEPFKGMLQQRVSDLDARRREAEMLINLAKKLDREEQKVYLLENLAVKALTQKKVTEQPLKALAHAVEASNSSSSSARTAKKLLTAPSSSAVIPPSQPSSSRVVQLPPEGPPVSSASPSPVASISSASTVEISVEEMPADMSSATDIPSSIVSIPNRSVVSSSVAVNSHRTNDSQLRKQLFVNTDCSRSQYQSGNQSNHQKALEAFIPVSSGSRKEPLLSRPASPINSPGSSIARLPTDSLSLSSDLDIAAAVNARLKALNHDLERQQRLLTQIKHQKRQTKNKDSLLRLEATLEQHQKLVEGIINVLKADIAACTEEKSGLMSLNSTSQVSLSSEASLSVSKLTVEHVPKPANSATVSVEVDVSPAQNEKSSDAVGSVAQQQAVSVGMRVSEKSNRSFNLDMSAKSPKSKSLSPAASGFFEASKLEAVPSRDDLISLEPDVSKTSADHVVPPLSSGRTSKVPSISYVSEKLSRSESDDLTTAKPSKLKAASCILAKRLESFEATEKTPKEIVPPTDSSMELLSRTLVESPNFGETPTLNESSSVGTKPKSVADKSASFKPREQECSSGEPATLKAMPVSEVSEKLEQSSQSNSILQLPSSAELLKSISGVCKANFSKLEGSNISNVVLTLDDSRKASTPIRSKQDVIETVASSSNVEEKPSDKNLSDEDTSSHLEYEKSCALDTIPSELSLATPSLNSDIKDADVFQEVASEKAPFDKRETHSEAETVDVYSEDFEDEEFPEEEAQTGQNSKALKPPIAQTPPAVSDPLSILSRIGSRAEELLEEWLDLFLEDALDEFVDDISLEVVGVTPDDLIPKHSTRSSIECREEIADTAGLIVNMPSRTLPLFKIAMNFFFKLRAGVQRGTFELALKSVEYPPEFSSAYLDEKDMTIYRKDPDVYFVSRPLFFDLLRTGMLEIFAGEDDDIQFNRDIVLTSARLHMWGGRNRPESQERWESYLGPQLEAILGISLNPVAAASEDPVPRPTPIVYDPSVVRGTVAKWTLNSKHYVDQLCEVELRADDSSWFAYKDFIKSIIEQSTKEVAEQMTIDIIQRVLSTPKLPNLYRSRQEETDGKDYTL